MHVYLSSAKLTRQNSRRYRCTLHLRSQCAPATEFWARLLVRHRFWDPDCLHEAYLQCSLRHGCSARGLPSIV
jgi:hypothetical protein